MAENEGDSLRNEDIDIHKKCWLLNNTRTHSMNECTNFDNIFDIGLPLFFYAFNCAVNTFPSDILRVSLSRWTINEVPKGTEY